MKYYKYNTIMIGLASSTTTRGNYTVVSLFYTIIYHFVDYKQNRIGWAQKAVLSIREINQEELLCSYHLRPIRAICSIHKIYLSNSYLQMFRQNSRCPLKFPSCGLPCISNVVLNQQYRDCLFWLSEMETKAANIWISIALWQADGIDSLGGFVSKGWMFNE